MILRKLCRLLQRKWRFHHRRHQPRRDVPFDMAMKEPDTGIIRAETEHDVAAGVYHEGVSAHGGGGEGFVADVGAGVVCGAGDGLEGVAV